MNIFFQSFFIASLVFHAAAENFRFSLGSCYKIQEIDKSARLAKVWDEIRLRAPDAFIWGGDNVYGDLSTGGQPAGKEILDDLYARNSNLREYQDFVQAIGNENIIGTWDDHDFGLNNAGLENPLKAEAQDAFLDFFNVPESDPKRNQSGVYSVEYFAGAKIKVILLDIRYNREPEGDENSILGKEQWEWLETELNENMPSTVEVTIIVSGIQILPQDGLKTAPLEIWGDFESSKDRLLQAISLSQAKSAILVSGDVHHSEISAVRVKRSLENEEYLIPELTTSGMTHSLGTSYGFMFALLLELSYGVNPFSYQYESLYTFEKNFGEIDIHFAEDPSEESLVTLRVFTSRGQQEIETTFTFDQLQGRIMNGESEAEINPVNDVSGFRRFVFYVITFLIIVAGVVYLFLSGILIITFSYRGIKTLRRKLRAEVEHEESADFVSKDVTL